MTRRQALKHIGFGALAIAAGYSLVTGCKSKVKDEVANGTLVMAKKMDNITGKEISLLGYGCMRFPTYDTGEKNARGRKIMAIDMEKSKALIDHAYANGITHYDTAWNYHNGKSAEAIGSLLKNYPRESFTLCNKMPGWLITGPEKAKELFQQVWIFTFGVSVLCATKSCSFTDAEIEELLGREFISMLMYIKAGKFPPLDLGSDFGIDTIGKVK